MERVWILMNYNYEDTYVVNLYSTKDKAEAAKARLEAEDAPRQPHARHWGDLSIEDQEVK